MDNKTNNLISKNKCPKCKSVYSNYSNLRKHVKKFHPNEETILAPPRYKASTNYKFSCSICARNFNQEKHIRYHMKTRHKTETPNETPRKPKKCPLCEYQDVSKLDLISHFEQVHSVVIHKRDMEMANADFQQWKNDLECKTNARFVQEYVKKYKNNVSSESYVCHRSGTYVPEGKGLRHLKTRGSTKINAFCPAGFKVRKEKLSCQVQFIETHVGHECDLDHLWLTKSEREAIAQKIAAEVPFDHILEEIRSSASDSALQRIHFLTRKDLHNIKSSLNLRSSSVHHSSEDINGNKNHLNINLRNNDEHSVDEPDECNAVVIESIDIETSKNNHQTPTSPSALSEEKEKIKKIFNIIVDNAMSFPELAVIKRMITPILPVQVSSTSQVPIKPDEKVLQNEIIYVQNKSL